MQMRDLMLLMEAHQLRQMIAEAREDGILKRFVPILVKDWDKLRRNMVNLSPEVIDLLEGIYSKDEIEAAQAARSGSDNEPPNPVPWMTMLAEGTIRYILANDPDPKKTFSTWMVTMFSRGFLLLEDLPRVTDGLAVYVEAKRAHHIPRSHDIGTVKTLDDFYDLIAPFRGDSQTGEIVDRNYEAKMYAQAEVRLDSAEYKIIIPKTMEAAQWFGRHSDWCTAWGSEFGRHPQRTCHYHSYSNYPIYIIQRKSDGTLWQFSFAHYQFMDVNDRQIDIGKWLQENRPAAQAIGMENFVRLIGNSITLRSFQPEDLMDVPTKLLVRHAANIKDFSIIPPETRDTPEFFFAMVNDVWTAGWGDERKRNLETGKAIFQHYVKILRPGVILQGVQSVPEYFPILPKKFHTEEHKQEIMNSCPASKAEECIPKPWSDEVKEIYYERAIASYHIGASDVEDGFLTDDMIVKSCSHDPRELGEPRVEERVTEDMMVRIIGWSHRLSHLGEYITDRFQTQRVANAFYERAKDAPNDEDVHIGMACLNYDLWPWKSGKLCFNIAKHLTCDYEDLPDAVKDNPKFTRAWIDNNVDNYGSLPLSMVNEETFRDAVRADGSRKGNYKLNEHRLAYLLHRTDTEHVKPEWIDSLNNQFPSLIEEIFTKIPVQFRSSILVQSMGKRGKVGFDDPSFTKENITPEMVTAFSARNYFRGYRSMYSEATHYANDAKTKEAKKDHVENMKKFWKVLPDIAKTEDVLIGFFDAKLDDLIAGMPKEALTANLLSAWVKRRHPHDDYVYGGGYGSTRGQNVCPLSKGDIFACFPETAYTAENMARAVELGVIKKVPENLVSDDVLIELMGNSDRSKEVNWNRVTPEIMSRAAKKHGTGLVYSKIPADILKQEAMAYALLDGVSKAKGSYFDIYRASFARMFAEPEMRVNWGQRLYNLAVSLDLVALEDVPAEFRNDDADAKAVKTRPANIMTIQDPVEWLTRRMPTDDFYSLLRYGFINTPQGWRQIEADVECEDGFYTVAQNRAGKRCVFLFDRHRNLVNIVTWQIELEKANSWDDRSFVIRDSGMSSFGLGPIRRTVAKACNDLRLGPTIKYDTLTGIGIWPNNDRTLVTLTEDLEREKFGGLTFVVVKGGWRKKVAHCYRGAGRTVIARIVVEEHGSDYRFVTCAFSGHLGQYLDLAANFGDLMGHLDCPAGTGKAFKESPLYVSLGVRGPGRYVWGSLLGEQVMTLGKLSVWKGMDRVTIAHSTHGILAVGKVTKDGSFTSTEDFTPAARELPFSVLSSAFEAMKGKIG